MSRSLGAACRDEEHHGPQRIECIEPSLVGIVSANLALDGFRVDGGTHSLGAVVEFDHVPKCLARRERDMKRAIGKEREAVRFESHFVLAGDIADRHSLSMSMNEHLHQKVTQATCVMVMSESDRLEVSPAGERCSFVAQCLESHASELEVVRRCTGRRGERPTANKPGIAESFEPSLQQSKLRERFAEGRTELEKLLSRKRMKVDCTEQFQVAFGEMEWSGSRCHRVRSSVASTGSVRL